jgi:hypothetical protein
MLSANFFRNSLSNHVDLYFTMVDYVAASTLLAAGDFREIPREELEGILNDTEDVIGWASTFPGVGLA